MRADQHPRLLQAILQEVRLLTERLGATVQAAADNADELIGSNPGGSAGYRHVCNLPDGTVIAIRRFERYSPSDGLQIEIQSGNRTIRVPPEPPFIPWSPGDDELPQVAAAVAPWVAAGLLQASLS